MPSTFRTTDEVCVSRIPELLRGKISPLRWTSATSYQAVEIKGRLIGGNLSVFYSMFGTSSFPDVGGNILFVEDVDEMLYHIDRIMVHMYRAGALHGLKAIRLGDMTEMRDNTTEHGFKEDNPFGRNTSEIISDIARECDIPLVDGFPVGHGSVNRPVISGAEVIVRSKGREVEMVYI